MDKYHKIKKINEDVYQIKESDFVNMYLILGSKKALLIDTGIGAGNLLEVVRHITSLPVEVVLTHNHCDHKGGASWFEKAYIHASDFNMKPIYNTSKGASWRFAKLGKIPYKREDRPYKEKFVKIEDGFTFDIGKNVLKAIHIPGHTKGSVVLLDKKHRIMFAGDNVGTMGQMYTFGAEPIKVWKEGIKRCIELSDGYDIYWGHEEGYVSVEDVKRLYDLSVSLLENTKKNMMFPVPGKWPKEGGIPSFVYNRRKVF